MPNCTAPSAFSPKTRTSSPPPSGTTCWWPAATVTDDELTAALLQVGLGEWLASSARGLSTVLDQWRASGLGGPAPKAAAGPGDDLARPRSCCSTNPPSTSTRPTPSRSCVICWTPTQRLMRSGQDGSGGYSSLAQQALAVPNYASNRRERYPSPLPSCGTCPTLARRSQSESARRRRSRCRCH